jgi:hypothetical protein
MKKLLPLLALSLALSFSACTKKEAAPEGAAEQQVEGTTAAPSEQAAPSEEMQEKKDEAPAAQ